jgi:hypothetical protein
MANGLLTGGNNEGHDTTTTHSAVSDGTLIVRDPGQQTQLIGEIGNQVADITRTEGQISAINAGKAELAKKGITEPEKGASRRPGNDITRSWPPPMAIRPRWQAAPRRMWRRLSATTAI